jgi:spoIIIJ-associated protein
MDTAREFEGRTLDEAIEAACAYFDLPREKLEIDIIRDAKSGIFGIVGVRKAVIQARRAAPAANVGELLHASLPSLQGEGGRAPALKTPAQGSARPRSGGHARPPAAFEGISEPGAEPSRRKPEPRETHKPGSESAPHPLQDRQPSATDGRFSAGRESAGAVADVPPPPPEDDGQAEVLAGRSPDGQPDASAASLDPAAVLESARDIATRLVAPIAPGADVDVEFSQGRVTVHIDSSEDLGLLIGREGQTLSSLQYLASRMLARRMGSLVHDQMDAGDYRGRQDDKLRELALLLAERAKTTGRVCPTRPLSSYHRRIVHMTLQGDPDVQTRSSGEGPLKRVIIQRARPEQ